MKKLQQHRFSGHTPYALLHLDDIEHIVDIIKAQLPQITFKDEEYEYATLDEMKERLGPKVNQLEIVATQTGLPLNDVWLKIEGRRIWLSADKGCELLWHQVVAIIKRRVPWYSKIVAPWFWGWLVSMLTVLYIFFIDKQTKVFAPPAWFNVSVTIAALLLAFSIWHTMTHRGVILERRHAVKGFFSRNLDHILMLGMGALLTVLAKFVYSWLFG